MNDAPSRRPSRYSLKSLRTDRKIFPVSHSTRGERTARVKTSHFGPVISAVVLSLMARRLRASSAAQLRNARHSAGSVRSRVLSDLLAINRTTEVCELDEEMEKRSCRRIRDLVAQAASRGLSANEIGCARISIMHERSNHGRDTEAQTNPLHRPLRLATHGRSIQLCQNESRRICKCRWWSGW
jgi:hypothetical protein